MSIKLDTSLIDSLKPSICVLDETGVIVAVNKSWINFGKHNGLLSTDYGLGLNYIEISETATGEDEKYGKKVAHGIRKILRGVLNEYTTEYPCHSPYAKRWFNATITRRAGKDMKGAVVAHTDITKRVLAEEAFKERFNEVNYYKLALVESSLVVITDHTGIITYINNNFCRSSGYYLSELLGQDHKVMNSGYHSSAFIKEMWDTINSGAIWKGEFKNKTKKGHIFWLDTTIIPFKDDNGNIFQFVSVSCDITKDKKAATEEELLSRQLRLLTSHLQTVREEERRNIAREIHDELGQQLSALKMNLNSILLKAENDTVSVKQKALEGINVINEVIKSTKRIIKHLRPGPLDDLGLESAIESLLSDFSKRTGILSVYKTRNLCNDYSPLLGVTVYRLCQESLTNVGEHSHATKVWISLAELENNKLSVQIRDNGLGMNEESALRSHSFGILGMKERVIMLGGTFRIISSPNKGTQIKIILPIVS